MKKLSWLFSITVFLGLFFVSPQTLTAGDIIKCQKNSEVCTVKYQDFDIDDTVIIKDPRFKGEKGLVAEGKVKAFTKGKMVIEIEALFKSISPFHIVLPFVPKDEYDYSGAYNH